MPAIPEGLTLGIAITGAVLGILNTWRTFDRDRIHLRVTPKNYIMTGGDSGMCLEITNLGFLPVTITQVGIDLREPKGHNFIFIPQFTDDSKLPYRLEPRTSVTVYMRPGAHEDPRLREGGRAFAKTACGRYFRGTSPALKGHIAKLRAAGQKDRSPGS